MPFAFLTDEPIVAAAQDSFGFRDYAEALSGMALASETPLTIGICGPAGSGKTSLLRLIAARLAEYPVYPLWFDAGLYAHASQETGRGLLLQALAVLKQFELAADDAQQIADWEATLRADSGAGPLRDVFPGAFAGWVHKHIVSRDARLVIYVDHLNGLSLLETVQHCLVAPGSVCFVGMNEDCLTLPDAGRLEKQVQVVFALPPLEETQIDTFVARAAPDLPAETRHIFAIGLPPHPRTVKRALNAFWLRQALAQQQTTRRALDPTMLAKIVVIQEQHRELYRHLLDYPQLLQELELRARGGAHEDGPALPGMEALRPLVERYAAARPLLRILRDGPTFTALTLPELDDYLRLAPRAGQAARAPRDPDQQLWDDLLSNDLTRIRTAVASVWRRDLLVSYSRALAKYLQRERAAPFAQRLSAGWALGYLEDPRDFSAVVEIPAGEFPCGAEKLPYYMLAYRIGRYPVTNAQYAAYLQSHPEIPAPRVDEEWGRAYNWDPVRRTPPPGRSNQPVILITWDEAAAYCAWVGGRLPTQEEWERAARGTDGRSYPWGEAFTMTRANTRESGLGGPTPVGVYVDGESQAGVLDMAGNVWEWTASDHDLQTKIIRGGAWNFPADAARVFVAERSRPHNRSHAIGFRVVFPGATPT